MCRSALEYPPNGKRCEKHGSPAEQKARRDARNARRRERYHATKAQAHLVDAIEHATESSEITASTISHANADKLKRATEYLSNPASYAEEMPGYPTDNNETTPSDKDSKETAIRFGSNQTSPLSYLEATTDKAFGVASTNEVKRLILEDGSVGYFKGYRGSAVYNDTTDFYGHTTLGTANNEVAAYQLSQALGGGFKNLVPETVLREHNGDIGSFQAEVKGTTYQDHSYGISGFKDFPVDEIRRVATLDYLMGAQDRHGENIMVTTDEQGNKHLVLIDNGFGFWETREFPINASMPNSYIQNNLTKEDIKFTKEELDGLKQFVNEYKNKPLLSPARDKRILERARKLIKEKALLNIDELSNDNWAGW